MTMSVPPSSSSAAPALQSLQVQTLKQAGHWVASESNLQHAGRHRSGEHLVAICRRSSPSTPGQGRSRIDTGPEQTGGKKQIYESIIDTIQSILTLAEFQWSLLVCLR